jgi:hypothetical protein
MALGGTQNQQNNGSMQNTYAPLSATTFTPTNPGLGGAYSYNPATGTSGFTNNGQSAVQGAISTGVGNAYSGLNTTTQNLANQYLSGANSYYNGLAGNNQDLSGILGGYNSFLGGGNPSGGQASPSTNTGSTASGLGQFSSSMSPTQVNQLVNQYISAGGVPNTDNGAYWMNAWNQWGSSDPSYFLTRLQNGIVQNGGNAAAIGGGTASAPSGGSGGNSSAIGGWTNMAQTGGFTPAQIQSMQQQGEAPTRAAYQNMQNDLQTNSALTGGYAPNLAAAQANLGRQATQGISASDVATNAAIAQMQQQGQLAGLSGLTGAQLGALGGMTSAYGATPGMSSMLGQQLLGTSGQQLTGNSLANQIAQLLISGQLGQSQVPSNLNQALGSASQIGNLVGTGANVYSGLAGY